MQKKKGWKEPGGPEINHLEYFLRSELDLIGSFEDCEDHFAFNIPVTLDLEKQYGLGIIREDTEGPISLRIEWRPEYDKPTLKRVSVFVMYGDGTKTEVEMSDYRRSRIARWLTKEFAKKHSISLKKLWEEKKYGEQHHGPGKGI